MEHKRVFKTIGSFAVLLLCAIACVVTTGMIYAAAAENTPISGGEGTQSSPYEIANAADFVELMKGVNDRTAADGYFGKYFLLSADIDLSGIAISPIGDFTYPFKGHLNGNGFSFSGLNINLEDGAKVGLFGVISADAVIENLTVSGAVTGLSDVGGIVGLNHGRITGCVSRVTVSSKADSSAMDVGGICGYNKGTIESSYNAGTVIGYGVNTGGIAGLNASDLSEAVISNCFNVGKIDSNFYGAGGVAGHNEGKISGCYNNAAVTAYSTAGGIAGSNVGTIENVYNTAIVDVANNMAGGIAGSSEGGIYNAFNHANVNAVSQKGGICGFVSSNAVLDTCFFGSEAFSGKMTNRGNDYPNSAVLRDADMASADALTSESKMQALDRGRGAGVWTKRAYDDDYCYFPEIKALGENADVATSNYSKDGAKLERVPASVYLGTLSYVYDGTAHEPDVYKGDEKLVKGLDYTTSYSDNVNVGTTTATITLINYYKGVIEKNFTITKSPITATWTETQITYNGEVQHPEIVVASGCADGEEIMFAYMGAGTAVGRYTVTAELANTVGNENYSFEAVTCEYEIKPAPLTVTWSGEALLYNGGAQYPKATVTAGNIAGDTISLIYSGYENNIDAAEGYTVTVGLAQGGDNGNYILNDTHTYSIKKKPIRVSFGNGSFTYHGKAQYPKIAAVEGGVAGEEITFAYSGYERNIAAGDGYTAYAELANTAVNSNYEMAKTECVYSIAKRTLTIAFTDKRLIFNGKSQCPSFIVNGLLEDDAVEWGLSDYSGNINASTGKNYSLTVTPKSGSNYTFEPVTVCYDIAPMPITVAWNGAELVYNGKLQCPDAVVMEETPTAVELVYADYSGQKAGLSYAVTITADSKNYVVSNALTYDILPKKVTVKWSGDCFVYNGAEQFPIAEFTGVIQGDELCASIIYDQSIRPGQYHINVEITNPNYVLTDADMTYAIVPKPITLDSIAAENKIYDGTAEVRISGGTLSGILSGDNVLFVLGAGRAESENMGTWRVTAEVTLTGAHSDCYSPIVTEFFVTIEKATFSTDTLAFHSKTFAYDGKAKSLTVEGDIPKGLVVEYVGNGQTEIGEYSVTARFADQHDNYEPIPDLTAVMYVSQSRFVNAENNVKVEVDNGALPFGAQVKIQKIDTWVGEYNNKRALGAFDISLLHCGAEIQPNGKLKITLTLNKETLKAGNLVLLHAGGSGYEELAYAIDGNTLVFYTESLSEFVLLADRQSNALWIALASVSGAMLLSGAIALYVVTQRKKRVAYQAEFSSSENTDNTFEPELKSVPKSVPKPAVKTVTRQEAPFTLDGIACAGTTSFLASLCFKNAAKQKEIAGMSATKAQAYANGKGGKKRHDLYWQGKRIMKGSPEYVELLRRADKSINEINTIEQ